MSRAVLLRLLALLALSACSPGSTGGLSSDVVGPSGTAAEQRANLQTRIACRNRVNEMYDRRDRAEIYAPASTVNTPLSSNYQAGVSSRGLANQFDYERTRLDCERNSSTETVEPTAAPATPPARKPR